MLGEFSSQTARTDTTTALPATSNFLDGYNGLSSFIFAFSGHSMFLEIMSEMEVPKNFTKSLKHANAFMCVLYYRFVDLWRSLRETRAPRLVWLLTRSCADPIVHNLAHGLLFTIRASIIERFALTRRVNWPETANRERWLKRRVVMVYWSR